MERDRRFQTREKTDFPILFTKKHDDYYQPARVLNISQDGMYLESNKTFFQDDYFFIKTKNSFPDFGSNKNYNAFIAQVVWCEKKEVNSGYKIGVKKRNKAKVLKNEDIGISAHCCEICTNTLMLDIVKTSDHLQLCQNCFIWLSQLPSVVENNITRFSVGNVI